MSKTVHLNVKMDVERRTLLTREAASRGLTLSEFVRRRLCNEPLPPLLSDRDESEDDSE